MSRTAATSAFERARDHFERMYTPGFGRVSTITDVACRPGSTSVAFIGGTLQSLTGTPDTAVYVADPTAGTFRLVHGGAGACRMPKWSPDGARLAFLSDEGHPRIDQVRLLDRLDAGAPSRALSPVDGTVEYIAWSPDGRRLLIGAADLGADLAGSEGSKTAGPPPQREATWEPIVERGINAARGRHLWICDVADGVLTRIAIARHPWEAAWCGNDRIVAVISDRGDENAWYDARVVVIDLASNRTRVLSRNCDQVALVAGSPDGRFCAWVEAACSDRKVVAGDVVLYDADSDERTAIDTQHVDVTHLEWFAHDVLFYMGVRGLDTVAAAYTAGQPAPDEWMSTSESCGRRYPSGSAGGPDRFAIVLESYERPQQLSMYKRSRVVHALSVAHGGHNYTRTVAGNVQAVTWSGRDGLELQGLLVTPVGRPPYPLVLYVHGGPIFAWRNLWAMAYHHTPLLAHHGYAVLHTNPRGSSGRGQAFAAMVIGDLHGEETFDQLTAVQALIDRGVADRNRIAVMGASHGGQMTSWLATQTDLFRAAIAISPFVDFYSAAYASNMGSFFARFLGQEARSGGRFYERSPVFHVSPTTTPTLVMSGALDGCTPPSQAIEFHRALTNADVPSELVIYPNEGHGMASLDAQIDQAARILTWLERFVP